MGKSERPEHTNPPEIFYNEDEARKYTSNSRMIAIQVNYLSSIGPIRRPGPYHLILALQ